MPNASDVNWTTSDTTVANLTITKLGPAGDMEITFGQADIIVDAAGYYG